MKRIIVAFLLVLNIGTAYGADKKITSKTYVDNQIATKQDQIPAVDTNTVITHTGTAGEIGEKGIYDSTGNYVEQQTSLVTAGTANTGINTALENEFICIEEDTDGTCLIWKIGNQTEHASGKNLLDDSFMDNSTYGPITVNGYTFRAAKILPTENGKTYTLSANLTFTGRYYYYLGKIMPNGQYIDMPNLPCPYMWNNNSGPDTGNRNATCTFTATDNATYTVFWAGGANDVQGSKRHLTITDYQMEEGSTATTYEPYKNLYLPQNQ